MLDYYLKTGISLGEATLEKNVPTHIAMSTSKIRSARTCRDGRWNPRECNVASSKRPDEGKARVRGMVTDFKPVDKLGHIVDANNKMYTFWFDDVSNFGEDNPLTIGTVLEFDMARIAGGLNVAHTLVIIGQPLDCETSTAP